MKKLDDLDKFANRALRALSDVAVHLATFPAAERVYPLDGIVKAISIITDLHLSIVAADPSLEYHLDPDREPTSRMKELNELVDQAEKFIQVGNNLGALDLFRRILQTEPPTIVYENISQRVKALEDK